MSGTMVPTVDGAELSQPVSKIDPSWFASASLAGFVSVIPVLRVKRLSPEIQPMTGIDPLLPFKMS